MIISPLRKVVCVTCGVVFAVSDDFMASRTWRSQYGLVCPAGHYTQFTARKVDGHDLIEELRNRIAELEDTKKPVALQYRVALKQDPRVDALQAENTRLRDQIELMKEMAEKERTVPRPSSSTQRRDRFGHFLKDHEEDVVDEQGRCCHMKTPLQPKEPKKRNTSFEPPGECPYCHKQYGRPRKHAREMHREIYDLADFKK